MFHQLFCFWELATLLASFHLVKGLKICTLFSLTSVNFPTKQPFEAAGFAAVRLNLETAAFQSDESWVGQVGQVCTRIYAQVALLGVSARQGNLQQSFNIFLLSHWKSHQCTLNPGCSTQAHQIRDVSWYCVAKNAAQTENWFKRLFNDQQNKCSNMSASFIFQERHKWRLA